MLPKQCVRRCSSHRSSPRRPTYSSLSRCQRSLRYRPDDIQPSPSISVSDEQQRSSHLGLANANSCELNGLASRGEQQTRAAAIREAGGREYARSVSRGSDTSQLTMMTSISKQGLNEGNNNMAANECLLRIHRSPKAVALGNVCVRALIRLLEHVYTWKGNASTESASKLRAKEKRL